MLVWMKHAEHGHMPVYDATTVKENERNDWKKMTPAEVEELLHPKRSAVDVLKLPIGKIVMQLESCDDDFLALMRADETKGKNRKSLLAAIDEELECRQPQT